MQQSHGVLKELTQFKYEIWCLLHRAYVIDTHVKVTRKALSLDKMRLLNGF